MSETIEDVLREMRDAANLAPTAVAHENMLLTDNYYDDECQGWLTYYADRIEAAYRRDLQSMVDAGESDMQTAVDEVAKLREENAELRTENAQLTEAMSSVVGCADSTCGGMGVCRTCKVAQFTGGAE